MKKELIYKKEKISPFEIIAFIIFNILAFLILYSVIVSKTEYNESTRLFFLLFLLVYLIILYNIYLFHIFLPAFKARKKNRLIKEKGIKVPGFIEKFDYKIFYQSYMGTENRKFRKIKYFQLHVSYIHPETNQKEEYITPPIDFSPLKDLGSRNCTVYIFNSDRYVTDFVKNENHQKIWDDNDLSVIQMQENIRKFKEERSQLFKFGLFLLILFICSIFFLIWFAK